ncbi:unnamed protein product [Rhizoctonia solani]|uniref:F-box domain-containing protein n=1 Tax=Rhizoctonia solani TaxID=456999 RepID=A0A8H3DHV5_9AGAM|nr:unnamed protein product [Rhizoctonia solani]
MRGTSDTGFIRSQGLSPELIIKILHCCDPSTILRFAATCKAYCELVAQSTSLQLHIELEANGLELVKVLKQDTTYSMILEDIKKFRDPWYNLDFREPVKRPLRETRGILWRLRQGFYIKAFSQSRGQYSDALQFIPLDPQALDPPPLMFEFTFWAFAADPGQGLAAMISRDTDRCNTCHVHLRSSITGLAHPLAKYPRLSAEFDFEVVFQSGYTMDIEIMERMVFAKVSNQRPSVYELLIWDWRLGTLLHRISFERGRRPIMALRFWSMIYPTAHQSA